MRRGPGVGRAGQALLELAVFGSIAIAAIGFLIRVGMKMNFDQEVRMGAFRRALASAHSDNGTDRDAMAVVYHLIADRQMPNPGDGYMSMPRSRTQAQGFVEWGDRLTFANEPKPHGPPTSDVGRATQPVFIVRVNDQERSFRQDELPEPGDQLGDAIAIAVGSSLVRQSEITNTSGGTIRQTKAGSTMTSGTSTCSTTTINTRAQDTIGSCIGGGGGSVSWSAP